MRFVAMIAGLMVVATQALAEDAGSGTALTCAEQAALVAQTVEARVDGARKGKTRRGLRQALGRNAGDMLADWVWSLPEDSLTHENIAAAADAWEVQCKSL